MRKIWALPAEHKLRYTGTDWLQVVLDAENEEVRAKLLLLLWRCWHHREDCMRHDGKESIMGSVIFLQKYEEDLRSAVGTNDNQGDLLKAGVERGTRTAGPIPKADKWSAPNRGTAKINTDAAFNTTTGESAAGAIARDYRGLVFLSVCKKLPECSSVSEAEARAALVGLTSMSKYYNGEVVLEMDNQDVIDELNSKLPPRSDRYGLIMDIKFAMKNFAACRVQYVNRKCNELAHGLAALPRSKGDQLVIVDIPPSLRSLMLAETCAPPE